MNNTTLTDNAYNEEMQRCFEWIKLCINSCTDNFQLECCRTLMQLFEIRFEDAAWQLNRELIQIITDKESMMFIL